MKSYSPNLQLAPISDRNYRPAFWGEFLSRRIRRESIAQRLHALIQAAKIPDELTPRQIERVAPRVESFLRDLSEIPAYRKLYDRVAPRLRLFALAALDISEEYDQRPDWSDQARAARAAVTKIWEAYCPKRPEGLFSYRNERGYYRSKRLAERLLNRDFPGLTAAERAYALIPFEPYRSWARAAQEARK